MHYVATIIGNTNGSLITPKILQKVSSLLGTNEIRWLKTETACDFRLPSDISPEAAITKLAPVAQEDNFDFSVIEAETRRKSILIADMDSTMIDQECIDELAQRAGIKEHVAAITAKTMNGELEFEPAVRERVALLKDLPIEVVDAVIENQITLAAGGRTLVQTMKQNGAYCALVSGGFTVFTGPISRLIGFDEHRSNELAVEAGKLTGEVVPPILGSEAKVEALDEITNRFDKTRSDAICVGDGANDLPMLLAAGTGVALHAKPTVAAAANIKINHADLTALLYIQGYTEDEIVWMNDVH